MKPVRPLRMAFVMQLLTALAIPFWAFAMLYQYQFSALRLFAFLGSLLWAPYLTMAAFLGSRFFDSVMAQYVRFSDKVDKENHLS